MKTKHILTSIIAILGITTTSHALTLSGGSATIDYDKAAWDVLAAGFGAGPNILTLDEFFDLAAVNARTSSQILNDEVQLFPSYTGQVYPMNGTSVSNLAGRTNQPTTFDFTTGNLTSHTGSIGLGGISQFEVSPLVGGGHLVYGDFTLLFDSARTGVGGTGWYLKGNITPAGAAFDILNVSVIETPTSITISGDLGVSYEVANFLYSTPADTGRDVGNFSFTGTVVPEPSSSVLLLSALAGVAGLRRRKNSRE